MILSFLSFFLTIKRQYPNDFMVGCNWVISRSLCSWFSKEIVLAAVWNGNGIGLEGWRDGPIFSNIMQCFGEGIQFSTFEVCSIIVM